MVSAAGNAPACSCSRSKRLTFRLRTEKRSPKRTEFGVRASGRVLTPAVNQIHLEMEMDGHEGSAPSIPVWKTGVCLSTSMPEEKLKWKPENPVSAPAL